MWTKSIVTFLIGLHLLPSTILKTPALKNIPQPTPQEIKQQAPANLTQNGLTISDEVYADLALQHELDHVSVYYFDDNPKNTISINPDKSFDPASTVKLYVAMYAFDQVASGNISLDQQITIQDKNVVPSQTFQNGYGPLQAGDTVSVYELLDRMITQSGNTSYNTLLDLLDRQKITKYIHDLGLTSSGIGAKLNLDSDQETIDSAVAGFGSNTTNADDYARAFILINGQRIPGSTSLFDMLSRQKFNSMIPALLPKDVVVAHKTGELDPYYHDGGIIVASNRKYILSVFSDMGDPNVVAHISSLVYTNDANIIGKNSTGVNPVSEEINAPIDPLVAAGEPINTNVLAASTQKVKVPKFTAVDLGIKAQDLSGVISSKELPTVIIPADSRFHFLVDLGEKIRVAINPIPSVRANLEAENLKLGLAEANNLASRNKVSQANVILGQVDSQLSQLAKDQSVTTNSNLQSEIGKISETRFSILGGELVNTQDTNQKVELIKNIADEARNTTQNVKPYITQAAKANSLNQNPVIGKVVAATANSITVKTADGNNVTTQVDPQISTRSVGDNNSTLTNANEIKVGTTIAIAGGIDNKIKPSFVLTNIPSETADSSPVSILKINKDTKTLVIASASGVPVQVDLTSKTIIKGSDTSVSLDDLKPGDVVVVHGTPLNTNTNSSSATLVPSSTPSQSNSPTSQSSGGSTTSTQAPASPQPSISTNPTATVISLQTPQPTTPTASGTAVPATTKPSGTGISTKAPQATIPAVSTTSAPAPIKPTNKPSSTNKTQAPSAPMVIKGNVIQVIQTPAKPSKPAPSKPSVPSAPPAATPPPSDKNKH